MVGLGGYLKLVFKLDSAWNSKGLGRLVERLGRGILWGKGEVFVVVLKVFVDVCECVCGLDRLQKIFKNLANVCLKNSPTVPKNRHLKPQKTM